MRYQLLHIWGPFAVHSYGLCIAFGLFLFMLLVTKDPLFKKLRLSECFGSIVAVGIIAGMIGGRLLHILTNPRDFVHWTEWFLWWKEGYSILGTITMTMIGLVFYLRYKKIPVVPFFDLVGLYAPLLQGVARFGCLFAGCCHGIATRIPWAIYYTDELSIAPLYVYIHPTQLYSVAALFFLFFLLHYVVASHATRFGQVAACYMIGQSVERFVIDFWRANRPMISVYFSADQLVAVCLALGGCGALWYFSYHGNRRDRVQAS
jgi:phosphatidylglycerol---prolipoprotein diacylglyceryl transferase